MNNDYYVIEGSEESNFKRLYFIRTPTPKIEVEFMTGVKEIFYLNKLVYARHYYMSKDKYSLVLTFSNYMKQEIIGNIFPLLLELSKI